MSVESFIRQAYSSGGTESLKALCSTNASKSGFASAVVDTLSGEGVGGDVMQEVLAHALSLTRKQSGAAMWCDAALGAAGALSRARASGNSIYDDAENAVRSELADYYLNAAEYNDAVTVLAASPLVQAEVSAAAGTGGVDMLVKRLDAQLKCAEIYLQMDNPGEAETFLNKATSCVNAVTAATSKRAGSSIHSANDSSTTTSTTSALTTPLQMRYRLTAARVLDGARRYLEAAGRYFELIALVLSLDESEAVAAEDVAEMLIKCITCAVLARSGPPRDRLVETLFKDERCAAVAREVGATDNRLPGYMHILRCIHNRTFITRDEFAQAFEVHLLPHHKALGAHGLGLPERAWLEHNLTSLGGLYDNLYVTEAARLLGMDSAQKAEKLIARFISEGVLRASLDQTEGLLIFEAGGEEASVQAALLREVADCAARAEALMA